MTDCLFSYCERLFLPTEKISCLVSLRFDPGKALTEFRAPRFCQASGVAQPLARKVFNDRAIPDKSKLQVNIDNDRSTIS